MRKMVLNLIDLLTSSSMKMKLINNEFDASTLEKSADCLKMNEEVANNIEDTS